MKNLKKLVILIVSLSLIVLIAGCSNGNSSTANQTSSSTSTGGEVKDAQTAKTLALQAAGISEDNAVFFKVWKEMDDGVEQWEIELVSNGQKYEVELNAADGSVREQSEEAVVKGNAPSGCISADDAKAAALSITGVSADNAVFTEVKFETDDGVQKWELEFLGPDGKHDVELNAANGAVLETSVEKAKIME